MGLDYAALAAELTAGHPVTGAYNANDATAASELNALNIDRDAPILDIFKYCMDTRTHTNQGNDTSAANGTPSTLLGRIIMAAEQTSVPADPFGAGDTPATKTMNSRELHSAKAFWALLRVGVQSDADLSGSVFGDILSDLVNGGVMTTANRTAIMALSENKQSRAQQLGFGTIETVDVTTARA